MSKVGYKRPPPETRFQKGRSGNPKGRPKGKPTKTASQSIDEVLARRVPVKRADGKRVRMSLLEIMLEKLVQDSVKGDKAARKEVLALMRQRGEFTPPASKERVGVVVVERPCATQEEWLQLANQFSVSPNPLEGLPGLSREQLHGSRPQRPSFSPEEED